MSTADSAWTIAQALVRTTRTVLGVADVASGYLGAIATYGPGRRVPGMRVRHSEGQVVVEVHLAITYPPPLPLHVVAATVRDSIHAALVERAVGQVGPIDVVIAALVVTTQSHETRHP